MRHHSRLLLLWIVTIAAVAATTGTLIAAKPIERLTAFAVDMSNLAMRTRAGTIDIAISRWSTPEERATLVSALREGGADALLKALQKMKEVGYIRTPQSIGYPLRFAQEIPTPEGGKRIIIATDRYVSFLEATNQPRSIDYPFMLVDIRLGPDGKGTGKLMPLAKVTMNADHVVEIENYASEPVRLTEVRELK